MKLSVVVPVYNEKSTILDILKAIQGSQALGMEKEIILVDDYSTDGTREVIERMIEGKMKGLKILLNEKNLGKGGSLRRGFENATGDFVIIQDADLEYDPKEYSKLLEPLQSGEYDMVYGSRFLGQKFEWKTYYLANKFLTNLSNIFTGYRLTDMETCYKCFTRGALGKVVPYLKANRFEIEPEITAVASRLKMKIKEVPISYMRRSVNEGKKIGFRDGLQAIWTIITA